MRIAGSEGGPGILWNVSGAWQRVASKSRHTKESNSKTKDDHVYRDNNL